MSRNVMEFQPLDSELRPGLEIVLGLESKYKSQPRVIQIHAYEKRG